MSFTCKTCLTRSKTLADAFYRLKIYTCFSQQFYFHVYRSCYLVFKICVHWDTGFTQALLHGDKHTDDEYRKYDLTMLKGEQHDQHEHRYRAGDDPAHRVTLATALGGRGIQGLERAGLYAVGLLLPLLTQLIGSLQAIVIGAAMPSWVMVNFSSTSR